MFLECFFDLFLTSWKARLSAGGLEQAGESMHDMEILRQMSGYLWPKGVKQHSCGTLK